MAIKTHCRHFWFALGVLNYFLLLPSTQLSVHAESVPLSLPDIGLLSQNHYFIKNSESCIDILTFDGKQRNQLWLPNYEICSLVMQCDDSADIFFVATPKGKSSWSLYQTPLGGGSASELISSPLGETRFELIPLGTPHGYILAGWENRLQHWKQGMSASKIIECNPHRGLAWDSVTQKTTWLVSPQFLFAEDVWIEPITSLSVCEYNLATEAITKTEIPIPPSFVKFQDVSLWSMSADTFYLDLWDKQDTFFKLERDGHSPLIAISVGSAERLEQLKGMWGILQQSGTGSKGKHFLLNLTTMERTNLKTEKVHDMIFGAAGNPIILTEDSILVFDNTGKVCKKRYATNSPMKKD